MTLQDSAAEVEALVKQIEAALYFHEPVQRTALEALHSLAQQLEKLREERDELQEDLAAMRDAREAGQLKEAAKAERNAALERVKVLEETVREIAIPLVVDGDYIEEALRLQDIARRVLGGFDA